MISNFEKKHSPELIPKEKFSCFIIGESTLPVKCAELLLKHGHTIHGIISNDPNVTKWSEENNIPWIKVRKSRIFSFLKSKPFDYLLSANGDYVMTEEILTLPDKLAINYHDSPLPRYAGMYATSWAIMNLEKNHAVSWHIADKDIDTGEILIQSPVTVESHDTAFTLNLKCYEMALKTFKKLIEDLSLKQIQREKQDLTKRTYYGLYKRPATACIFSFHDTAEHIDAFLRALDFGSYNNPLGVPKITIGNQFFFIPYIGITDSPSEIPAGVVKSINDTVITVSTLTTDVEIREIFTLDGRRISINDIISECNLCEGYQIDVCSKESAKRIDEYNSIICHYEKYWVKRLNSLQPVALPEISKELANSEFQKIQSKKVRLPEIEKLNKTLSPSEFVISVFSIFLYKYTNNLSFDIGYSDASLLEDTNGLNGLFADQVPLSIRLNVDQTFKDVVIMIQDKLNKIKDRKTYVKDITIRYPILKSISRNWKDILTVGVTVINEESIENYKNNFNGLLNIVIPPNGSDCSCLFDSSIGDIDDIIKNIEEIALKVVEKQNIQLTEIQIIENLMYSELGISDTELDEFGF